MKSCATLTSKERATGQSLTQLLFINVQTFPDGGLALFTGSICEQQLVGCHHELNTKSRSKFSLVRFKLEIPCRVKRGLDSVFIFQI